MRKGPQYKLEKKKTKKKPVPNHGSILQTKLIVWIKTIEARIWFHII